MKIACVDKTAADRVALQKLFDDAFAESRSVVGHLQIVHTYPASKDEAILSSPPEIIAVGSKFSVEEAFTACHQLRSAHPTVPILVFLNSESYSLRTLRRFQKICSEIFTENEPAVRIVHKVSSLELESDSTKHGHVLLVEGVKGGVGATSLVAGLAHAAESIGKSAVVIDLSASASLLHYMGATRWQSSDYASVLLDALTPDKHFVERSIIQAPNGVNLLLPPAGGSDIRETWLRDSSTFEASLQIVELLRDLFDVVLIDLAGAEGIFPFALGARALSRLLVTSNEPASVHLLNSRLSTAIDAPGNANVHVVMNLLQESLLTREDILDFLYLNDSFQPTMSLANPIPFDANARHWVGTGNTFYTESHSSTQRTLDELLSLALLGKTELEARRERSSAFSNGVKKLSFISSLWRKRIRRPVMALPLPTPLLEPSTGVSEEASQLRQGSLMGSALAEARSALSTPTVNPRRALRPSATPSRDNILSSLVVKPTSDSALESDLSSSEAVPSGLVMYEAPQRVVNGSE